ncbi:hypothetical protein K4A83_08135 [Spirulina subsalsa FACHB-351]|uniref:Uncharacterized protein n=1 Tax=Spirulina subsalsa FACHB-351 TaxID=234711 RepID=A0ABT3L408_9CYAN|nr:hypothetical protein [Spirulina subsalsa FACHB-351]
MMLAPLLISLSIASVAVCLNINTQEEIVKVTAGFIALLCLFLSLFFAPWFLKLLILALPLAMDKLNGFKKVTD